MIAFILKAGLVRSTRPFSGVLCPPPPLDLLFNSQMSFSSSTATPTTVGTRVDTYKVAFLWKRVAAGKSLSNNVVFVSYFIWCIIGGERRRRVGRRLAIVEIEFKIWTWLVRTVSTTWDAFSFARNGEYLI